MVNAYLAESKEESPGSIPVSGAPARYSELLAHYTQLVRKEHAKVYPSSPLQFWRVYTPRAQAWALRPMRYKQRP